MLLTLIFTGILFTSHRAHAFTLLPSAIIYDPVSLFQNQSLHVHAMNNMGTPPYGIILICKPTESWLGTANGPTTTTLNQGDGMDATFTLAAFNPTPGTTHTDHLHDRCGGHAGHRSSKTTGARGSSAPSRSSTTRRINRWSSSARDILTTTNQNQPPAFCLFCK